ncbi:hypothetical protein Taro_009507 [Colocasia esculenta]|uniref:Aminotransferase-like plant mobile domain-containing protein n=1 Tax=Colocasia esculenta TaxID=4460 RepID=A0A843U473_COLES|nr:hypothetical protein [Colocasia esculenta]
MGFGEIFRMERMRADPALTQALRSRWDTEANAFLFPWGHMIPNLEDVSQIMGLRVHGKPVSGFTYPCYQELAERLLDLPVGHRSSLVPRVALQESLGLFDVGKGAGETEDEHFQRLVRVSQRELVSELGAEADLDLRRFLVLFLGRLLFATRGDTVHCRFLPLLEDLSEVGGYAWGAAFLAHQFDSLGVSEWQTRRADSSPFFRSSLTYTSQPWGEGISHVRASCPLHAVGILAETRATSGTSSSAYRRPLTATLSWIHIWGRAMRDSPGWCRPSPISSAVEFPVRDRYCRPGWSFRGLHDTTDWRERAKEQISHWERKGKAVKSSTTTDDAYLQAYALKYGGKVYKSARHQDRETAQRQTEELRRELERVRSTGAGGASSSRAAGSSPLLLEAQLTGAVLRAEEAQRHLEEREKDFRLTSKHAMELQGQRDQL